MSGPRARPCATPHRPRRPAAHGRRPGCCGQCGQPFSRERPPWRLGGPLAGLVVHMGDCELDAAMDYWARFGFA